MKEQIPQIVLIVNDKTVIINQGSRENVKEDDVYNILDPDPFVLRDPNTKEILGIFKQYKQKIYVKEVKEKYSICVSTFKSKQVSDNLKNKILGSLINISPTRTLEEQVKQITIGKKMNVNSAEEHDILSKYNYKIIHKGDKIQKIIR